MVGICLRPAARTGSTDAGAGGIRWQSEARLPSEAEGTCEPSRSQGPGQKLRRQPCNSGWFGLGRMGANMVRRLMHAGHTCVVYDVNADAVKGLEAEGATGALTLEDFVAKLVAPKAVWVMVPAGYAGETVNNLAALMSPGDIIIDGGNSYYHDDIARAAKLKEQGIHFVDVARAAACSASRGDIAL